MRHPALLGAYSHWRFRVEMRYSCVKKVRESAECGAQGRGNLPPEQYRQAIQDYFESRAGKSDSSAPQNGSHFKINQSAYS